MPLPLTGSYLTTAVAPDEPRKIQQFCPTLAKKWAFGAMVGGGGGTRKEGSWSRRMCTPTAVRGRASGCLLSPLLLSRHTLLPPSTTPKP